MGQESDLDLNSLSLSGLTNMSDCFLVVHSGLLFRSLSTSSRLYVIPEYTQREVGKDIGKPPLTLHLIPYSWVGIEKSLKNDSKRGIEGFRQDV